MVQPIRPWFVYILECRNGRLYTGITVDLEKRFLKHSSGKGAMFTRLNRPVRIIGAKICEDRSQASKLECVLKKMKPEQKRLQASAWPIIRNLPQC